MEVTNADKVMFPDPGYTKADLVGYYDAVADRMVPWLDGRPLTLERHPDGVGTKGFMQKHASRHFSDRIGRVEVPKSDGTVNHPVVRDRDGLLELANQGTITFHVWTAALPDLDRPSHLVLDLDPEAEDLDGVRQVAFAARDLLDRFDLEGMPVASGKKGFHIWVPIAGHDYEAAGLAARAMAGLIAAELPDVATVEFRKRDRAGRVFVDWLRNRRAQSIVCPWSLRTTPLATVATPLDWEEVAGAMPNGWTIRSAPRRRQPDLPAPFRLDLDRIVGRARAAGADLDSEFDRFGRT
ncbi:MAG TPA: non-homologous end-joining DNA ligase [Acidimicrobiia bacterium]|nr:non-homologous end-joining DNA ligase [Acidimicrobiia bacterium]